MRAVVVLLLFSLVGCQQIANKVGVAEPAADYSKWTHKELTDHLEKKGLKFKWDKTEYNSFFCTPAIAFFHTAKRPVPSNFPKDIDLNKPGYVLIMLYDTEQKAKDKAGNDSGTTSWHRFQFEGDKEAIRQIVAALPK